MLAVQRTALPLLVFLVTSAAGSTFPVNCDFSRDGSEAVCIGWCPLYIRKNVTTLRCQHNGWRIINGTLLHHFAHLITLDLSFGRISQILPDSFQRMKELQHLDLSNNMLSALSYDFSELPKLRSLNLSGNPLTLSSREPFRASSSLETLDVSSCSLTDLWEDSLGKLSNLSELRIRNNPDLQINGCPFVDNIKLIVIDGEKEVVAKLKTVCHSSKPNAPSMEESNKTLAVSKSSGDTISSKRFFVYLTACIFLPFLLVSLCAN
ncbi:leucine-rich repeat-containing protein 40-like [Schistocerca gregaria]|uniref:leucine-rich repeat-containing protein 40-like n=1 Tax=Schistocerca gregaria TaxID=7010 RepID=UPI00211E2F59|nr:leucine-rich repeat-containing protein 40-like [Schistocerca gregaria]XP_049837395.1 leucine-rich repeat-containing protein 40-like [Schistocerca gregaria]